MANDLKAEPDSKPQSRLAAFGLQAISGPFSSVAYRTFFLTGIAVNTGMFMQDVAAAWLMTSMSKSPVMVALMQTAAALPFFLLALPAGALADLVNRRHLLLFCQAWMMTAVITLGLLTITDFITPWLLLILTFLLGVGLAAAAPCWNAMTPELVERKYLESAIALGSAGYNLARVTGAALGGLLVASIDPGGVILLNAVGISFMIIALYRWKPTARTVGKTNERMLGAIRAGMRYVRHSPPLSSVLVRTVVFATSASALWALIPLIGREQLGLNSKQFGLLIGVFGIGTLIGALTMPRIRRRFSLDRLSALSTIIFALSLVLLASTRDFGFACLGMIGCGIGWTAKNSTLNVSAQLSCPTWVRARVMSVYLLVFQGCIAFGALLWGTVANWQGMTVAMYVAAAVLVLGLATMTRYQLSHIERLDVNLSNHWKDPHIGFAEPHPEDGPVLVTVEYQIDPSTAADFQAAIRQLEIQRRRDGAYQWHLFCDLSNPERYVETFMVESWGEHVRQHERVTNSDKLVEERVDSFHIGSDRPIVTHYIHAQEEAPEPSQRLENVT